MMFLKKEISRNKSAIDVARNMSEEIQEDAQAVRDDGQRGDRPISIAQL